MKKSAFIYLGAAENLVGSWTSPGAVLRVLLARDSYVPNVRHESISQIVGELDGRALSKGYTRQDLAGRRIQGSAFMADNVTWSGLRSVETYRFAVIASAAGRPLICADMGAVSLRAVTDHTVRWGHGSGLVFSVE